MKKIIIMAMIMLNVFGISFATQAIGNFSDVETVTVNGNRPVVDISASVLTVTVDPDNFNTSGIAEKTVVISNNGNVTARLAIIVSGVPNDLNVLATVDNTSINPGGNTNLKIKITLSEMQQATAFTFTVRIIATR